MRGFDRNHCLCLWLIVTVSALMFTGCGDAGSAGLRSQIREVVDAHTAALNRGDLEAAARLWTADAELVYQSTGVSLHGRERIFRAMKAALADDTGLETETVALAVQRVAPDIALGQGLSRFTPRTGAVQTSAFVSLYSRRDGRWLIHRVWQSPVETNPHYDQLADLAWMIGEWSETTDGKTTTNVCRWGRNRTSITRSFEIKKAGAPEARGTEVIGWDPVQESIRSWTFNADGGYAECRWVQKEGRWKPGEVTGQDPDSTEKHRAALADLAWMQGQWAHKSDKQSVAVSARFVADGMYLLRRFKAVRPGQWEHEGVSVLGWDPGQKQIRSWLFDTDGGTAEAQWQKENDKWISNTRYVLPDGKCASAIIVYRRISDNAYSWQRISQEVDGELLPSGPEVRLERTTTNAGK